ncbi:MAG: hypothetical protein IJ864_05130 [Alphaproteobacteria bacterium]|nr:hypothetical protein [Alphaproteobacteria bacterium]
MLQKVLLSLFFGVVFSCNAIADPRYVADVSVDETAKTVTEAKQKAMSKAMRDGINEIVRGISTEQSVEEIDKLTDNQMAHFVTEVMVLMEKTSDVRYIADLRISVDGDILKAYLAENNMPIVLSQEIDAVVIPLLEEKDGALLLWENDNLWREALQNKHPLHKMNMNIRLLDKNLGNIAMAKATHVYDLPDGEYNELLNFNKADALFVAKYSLKDHKIYLKEYPSRLVQTIDIDTDNPESMVEKLLPLFKDITKEESASSAHSIETIQVIYNYSRLSQWMTLKQILDNNPQVQNIQISSMANGKVHFSFEYGGVIEKLQGHLNMSGYNMHKEGEHYVIN